MRYYVKAAGNSAHVIDSQRKNEWGEPWVEQAWLTPWQAEAEAARLNAEAAR